LRLRSTDFPSIFPLGDPFASEIDGFSADFLAGVPVCIRDRRFFRRSSRWGTRLRPRSTDFPSIFPQGARLRLRSTDFPSIFPLGCPFASEIGSFSVDLRARYPSRNPVTETYIPVAYIPVDDGSRFSSF